MFQQHNLFEMPPAEKPKPAKGMRCKNCMHCYRHQYNDTRYCRKQSQRGTSYGHKKIKANDSAMQCPFFEKRLGIITL